MAEFEIVPTVDEAQEFIEIANDFANPLDIVREAISNAYDAGAKNIRIVFSVEEEFGESVLLISLEDDGNGMDFDGLQSFFDLGNSPRRNDPTSIGEKGHGTKIYFNSRQVEIWTRQRRDAYHARMDEPYRKLCNREIPRVVVEAVPPAEAVPGTRILIRGYTIIGGRSSLTNV